MSRTGRIARNIAIGLAALVVVVLVAAVIVVQTGWFRGFVKDKIISAVEDSTGGKAEIGSFEFDPSRLHAVVTNFVIHGREPAGTAPFVRIRRIVLDLRPFTNKRAIAISYLGVEQPEANIMVMPDGQTNVPTPKTKSTSDTSGLETVVDLAVERFELTNGLSTFDSRKQPLHVSAENLRALLTYNMRRQGYEGQLSLQPLYVVSGRETPVQFTITLPVALERDRIEIRNASISTAASRISIDGSVENMRDPKVVAHLGGRLAMVDLRNAGNLPVVIGNGVPGQVDLDANATVSNSLIQVRNLRVGLGQSTIEASGTLKDSSGNGALRFQSRIDLAEAGRLMAVTAKPSGLATLGGTARLDANNNYRVDGNIEASDVAFQQGARRVKGIRLVSAVHADPQNANLSGLKLTALGGELDGDASLRDSRFYEAKANLRNFDIQTAARTFGQNVPWTGSLGGTIGATGDTKAPGTKSVMAQARLSIAPGRRGVPVSGSLNADYNGEADDVRIGNSYIAWPHSRLTVDGSVNQQLNIALRTRDLNDFLVATSMSGRSPVELNQGEASFTGRVTGTLTSPHITGHLAANRFSVEGREFNALGLDLAASNSGASLTNGSLTRDPMQAQFNGSVGLRNWQAPPSEPVMLDLSLRNGDLADVVALAGEPAEGYAGALSAMAHVRGTVGDPQGNTTVQLGSGMIAREPIEQAQLQVNLASGRVTIPTAYIVAYGGANPGRIDLAAEFQHPPSSFTTGHVHAHVQSTQIDLAKLHTVQEKQPESSGAVQLNADVNGDLNEVTAGDKKTSQFLLSSVSADVSARAVRLQGQNYGDLSATARTSAQTVNYNLTSNLVGSNIRVNGATQLARDYPTTADASIANLAVDRVLTLAKQTGMPARGVLSGMVHVKGTVANPAGNGDLELVNGAVYGQPIDRMRARMTYEERAIDIPQVEIVSGPSRIDLNAHYDHPAGNLREGSARFSVNNSRVDLSRVEYIQTTRPGVGGIVRIDVKGAAAVRAAEPRVLLSELNANIAATDIAAQGKKFGGLTLTANTTAGNRLNFALDSDIASASIHGRGNMQLAGDYPVNGQVSFSNIQWTRLRDLMTTGNETQPGFEASTEGQITVNGPLMKTNQINGSFQLSKLNVTTLPKPGAGNSITISNQGPIVVALDNGSIRIQSARIAGPQTELQAEGTAPLDGKPMNVSLNAKADLGILPNFNPDIYSAGNLAMNAVVRGTMSQPLVNGQVTLSNASFNYNGGPASNVSNGIYNANGVIALNGNNATIRNLTAESGGGKITAGGFASYAGLLRFALRANAMNVRVPVQQGASVTVSSDIRLNGTEKSSILSGTVTIDKVSFTPQGDIGSMLSSATPPVQSATPSSSDLVNNMKLDIRIRTTSGTALQIASAQNMSADADLRIRGTPSQLGALGRVTLTKGQLVFFGATYTINNGTISFFNPIRIDPILDISLQTQTGGVDVTLHVTGPVENMNLSYTSNPPLQFQEIVGLLASGKAPGSDPTLLANQQRQPSQSYQQMGESAILGKAVADPVSSQLQRVFGVSQFKIDPSFSSGSSVPTARLTLQQRINSNLTFTYTSALDDPNGQIIRIEWTFNPQWSAMAVRDQNGLFSLNFRYKRQFR